MSWLALEDIGEEIGSLVARFAPTIARGLARAAEVLKSAGSAVASAIRNGLNTVARIVTGVAERVRAGAARVVEAVKSGIEAVKNFFRRVFSRGSAGSKVEKAITAADAAANAAWVAEEIVKNKSLREKIKEAGKVIKNLLTKIPLTALAPWAAGIGLAIWGAKEFLDYLSPHANIKTEVHKNDRSKERVKPETRLNRYPYPERNETPETKKVATEVLKHAQEALRHLMKVPPAIPSPAVWYRHTTAPVPVDLFTGLVENMVAKVRTEHHYAEARKHVDDTAREMIRQGKSIAEVRHYVKQQTKTINEQEFNDMASHNEVHAYTIVHGLLTSVLPYTAMHMAMDYVNRGQTPPEKYIRWMENPVEELRRHVITPKVAEAMTSAGYMIQQVAPVIQAVLGIAIVAAILKEIKHVVT